MRYVLVVDDSAVDRRLAGSLLEAKDRCSVAYAEDGRKALASVAARAPDAVVTDLRMPGLDGLQLVEALRRAHPGVPVVLMTAHGSEDVAAAALRSGAASYVPKRMLAEDLARTVARVVELSRAGLPSERVLGCLEGTEASLVLDSDPKLVTEVVAFLRGELARLGFADATRSLQVGVALDEAISNAVHHGNLEVSSKLREGDARDYLRVIDERRRTPPWSERRARVRARVTREVAEFVVRDEGPGFDHRKLPDPMDAENLEKCSGRGVLLIRSFMDDVRFNDAGNEITMTKRLR